MDWPISSSLSVPLNNHSKLCMRFRRENLLTGIYHGSRAVINLFRFCLNYFFSSAKIGFIWKKVYLLPSNLYVKSIIKKYIYENIFVLNKGRCHGYDLWDCTYGHRSSFIISACSLERQGFWAGAPRTHHGRSCFHTNCIIFNSKQFLFTFIFLKWFKQSLCLVLVKHTLTSTKLKVQVHCF